MGKEVRKGEPQDPRRDLSSKVDGNRWAPGSGVDGEGSGSAQGAEVSRAAGA